MNFNDPIQDELDKALALKRARYQESEANRQADNIVHAGPRLGAKPTVVIPSGDPEHGTAMIMGESRVIADFSTNMIIIQPFYQDSSSNAFIRVRKNDYDWCIESNGLDMHPIYTADEANTIIRAYTMARDIIKSIHLNGFASTAASIVQNAQ